jgi:hypothetical protein
MFFKTFALVTVAFKNKKQSLANRRWEIIGAFLQILAPCNSPLYSAYLMSADSPSAHMINR